MQFQKNETALGPVYGANGVYALIPVADEILTRAVPVLDNAVEAANAAVGTYLPEALPDVIDKLFRPAIAVTSSIIDAARRDALEQAEREVILLTPVHATADLADRFGAEVRGIALRSTEAERAVKVHTASATEAAALLALPEAAGLSADQVEALKDRAILVYHVERAALAAGRGRKPTVDRLTAVGVDHDAVLGDAQVAIAQFHAERDRIEEREGQLQNLVGFIAAGLGVQPSDVLDRILAA